jgi:hypothetical protein
MSAIYRREPEFPPVSRGPIAEGFCGPAESRSGRYSPAPNAKAVMPARMI